MIFFCLEHFLENFRSNLTSKATKLCPQTRRVRYNRCGICLSWCRTLPSFSWFPTGRGVFRLLVEPRGVLNSMRHKKLVQTRFYLTICFVATYREWTDKWKVSLFRILRWWIRLRVSPTGHKAYCKWNPQLHHLSREHSDPVEEQDFCTKKLHPHRIHGQPFVFTVLSLCTSKVEIFIREALNFWDLSILRINQPEVIHQPMCSLHLTIPPDPSSRSKSCSLLKHKAQKCNGFLQHVSWKLLEISTVHFSFVRRLLL